MLVKEAIAQLEKAQKEYAAANAAFKEAADNAHRAWDIVPNSELFKKDGEKSPAFIAAMEASEKEKELSVKYNIASAVNIAASYNVGVVAVNRIREAIEAAPEKFNKPIHYKAFLNSIQEITGNRFYLDTTFNYSLYIKYFDSVGKDKEFFICDLENGQIKVNETLSKRNPELTLIQIKKEAKKAVRDSEKLKKAAEKFKALSESMQAGYSSYIKYVIPHANYTLLNDDYRLF